MLFSGTNTLILVLLGIVVMFGSIFSEADIISF